MSSAKRRMDELILQSVSKSYEWTTLVCDNIIINNSMEGRFPEEYSRKKKTKFIVLFTCLNEFEKAFDTVFRYALFKPLENMRAWVGKGVWYSLIIKNSLLFTLIKTLLIHLNDFHYSLFIFISYIFV